MSLPQLSLHLNYLQVFQKSLSAYIPPKTDSAGLKCAYYVPAAGSQTNRPQFVSAKKSHM